MYLNKNAFIICFVSVLSFFIFSKAVLAFVTQGTASLNKRFAQSTEQGSIHYLAGISSAIMAFSAIEKKDLKDAKNKLEYALRSWKDSKLYYEKAKTIGTKYRVFNLVDQWIIARVRVVFEKFYISEDYGIGKDIKVKIDNSGSEGLIDMTIISVDNLRKDFKKILEGYQSNKNPTYEDLLNSLNFISDELKKGVIASEIFLMPR